MPHENELLLKSRFSELYDKLFRFASIRLPIPAEAEDLVGATMLEVWRGMTQFNKERGDFDGWVFGIARHKLADYWKKQREVLWDEEVMAQIPDERSEIAQTTDDRLRYEHILRSLSPETRALLAFRHVDGLTHEEIASIIGKSPEAVRQALSRLHRELRNKFPQYDIND